MHFFNKYLRLVVTILWQLYQVLTIWLLNVERFLHFVTYIERVADLDNFTIDMMHALIVIMHHFCQYIHCEIIFGNNKPFSLGCNHRIDICMIDICTWQERNSYLYMKWSPKYEHKGIPIGFTIMGIAHSRPLYSDKTILTNQ